MSFRDSQLQRLAETERRGIAPATRGSQSQASFAVGALLKADVTNVEAGQMSSHVSDRQVAITLQPLASCFKTQKSARLRYRNTLAYPNLPALKTPTRGDRIPKGVTWPSNNQSMGDWKASRVVV